MDTGGGISTFERISLATASIFRNIMTITPTATVASLYEPANSNNEGLRSNNSSRVVSSRPMAGSTDGRSIETTNKL